MPGDTFTSRAVAYLKPHVPEDDRATVLELSHVDSPVLRPLATGLLVAYVVDMGDAFSLVQNRHLEEDGLSPDELHRIALGNLSSIAYSGRLQVHPHPSGSSFAATMGGNFEASLILIDELWDDTFRQFIQGEYAVAIPARDILGFCDGNSPEGLAELHRIVERMYPAGDHLLSDKLFLRQKGKWVSASI